MKQYPTFLSGQSLGEYSLALGIISLVAVVSLASLSGNINGLFGEMISNRPAAPLRNDVSTLRSTQLTPSTNSNILKQSSGSNLIVPSRIGVIDSSKLDLSKLPGKNIAINLSGRGTLNFNVADYKAAADSAGGLGTTANSNAILTQLIRQLESQPELTDPVTLKGLKDLAFQGYSIQYKQEILQNFLALHPVKSVQERDALIEKNSEKFYSNNLQGVTLNEILYGLGKSTATIPTSYDSKLVSTNFENFNNGGPFSTHSIEYFLSLTAGLRNSKLMQDNPALKELIIDTAARQIYFSSTQTVYSSSDQEVAQQAALTNNRSDLICRSSQASQCKNQ
jgi:hypothetical protein